MVRIFPGWAGSWSVMIYYGCDGAVGPSKIKLRQRTTTVVMIINIVMLLVVLVVVVVGR